jgi:hypothetical protein
MAPSLCPRLAFCLPRAAQPHLFSYANYNPPTAAYMLSSYSKRGLPPAVAFTFFIPHIIEVGLGWFIDNVFHKVTYLNGYFN